MAKYDAIATRPDPIPPPPDEVDVYIEVTANPPTPATVVAEGPQGPKGDPGRDGLGASRDYFFADAVSVWIMDHDFNLLIPDVTTVDINDEEIMGDVSYPFVGRVVVEWYYPTAGRATLRD